MSTKILNVKRAIPRTHVEALLMFKEVKEDPHFLSDEEAAMYTLWRLHRKNMGSDYAHDMRQDVDGPSLLRNHKGWQTGAVHEHAEQVFKNLFVYPLGFNTLRGYHQEASFQRILEHNVWHRSARGVLRFQNITRLDYEWKPDMTYTRSNRNYAVNLLSSGSLWADVVRGRDLFIPGLGGFDIRMVADSLNDNVGLASGIIPSPAKFAAYGYSMRKIKVVAMDENRLRWINAHKLSCMIASGNQQIDDWGRRWYLKDCDTLMDHMGVVTDELKFVRAGQIQEVIPNLLVHPSTVRENLERVRVRQENSAAFPLSMKYHNHDIPEIAYTIDDKLLKLRPVADFTELSGIAKQFGNCAAIFHDSILSGESVVVPVINDKEEVIALAEIGPTGDVRQLEGPNHAEIEDASISSCVDKYAIVVAASTIKDMTDSIEE